MKALLLDGSGVRAIDIENKLEAFQEAVDGYIETVTLVPDEVVMIVNEEGLLRGLGINPLATALYGSAIVGVAVVVSIDGEEFCDVPERYLRRFGV
jgi:hypothetical protein